MSVFAVRVRTNEEIEVKDQLRFLLEKKRCKLVKAILAIETYTQLFRGKKTTRKDFRNVTPGYIFVETNDHLFRMEKELWHIINGIPLVYQIFEYCIPQEEVDLFFETCDVDPAIESHIEPNIDISFSKNAKTGAEIIKQEREALHTANMQGEEFKSLPESMVDQVHQLKENAMDTNNEKLNRLMSKCKAFIRRKKETFIFPYSVFLKTIDRIDPYKRLKMCEITNGDFIIPEMVKTLEGMVMIL